MKGSIFLKIFTGYVLVAVVLTSLVLLFTFKAIREQYIDMLRNNLISTGTALELHVKQYLEQGQIASLDRLVKDLGGKIEARITVIDPHGDVLADSDEDPDVMENQRTRPEIARALRGSVGTAQRYSTAVEEDMLSVALPLSADRAVIGVLRLSFFLSDIDALIADLRSTILRVAATVLGLALLGALVLSRGLTRPIEQLHSAARTVAAGDFDVRVILKGSDQLQELAESFNHMTDRIRILFDELSRQGEELRSIVSSIKDGLLVVDRDGRILMSNQAFERIAGTAAEEGRFFWEVVRAPELDELVRKIVSEKASAVTEVSINDVTYLCSAAFVASREGAVVLLHDISAMKNLEKIKKDFVVNLSHELRTPLTAISGFLETLEDEVSEEGSRYLSIVRRHTARLTSIVEDLLQLSALEDFTAGLELESVNLKDMITAILHAFEPGISSKNLKIDTKVLLDPPTITADRFKLEQVFINLIDNAIKYTDQGSIGLSVEKDGDSAVIAVEDSGVGIPEEDLPRVFERFYVVDKSRSRKLGGTGLGLSIVKHIVLLHNGSVDITSNVGEGTRVTITLPITQPQPASGRPGPTPPY
jgi:two-component system phosphate regulon sensor histidine kinase PhoR